MARNPSPVSTHRSIRSSASTTRPQTLLSSTYSARIPSPESTHCSLRSKTSHSSTARPSIHSSHYSHTSEKTLLLPSCSHDPQTEERIWAPFSHTHRGQRTETKHQRGCAMPRASLFDQSNWKRVVQGIIRYDFMDVDLLEEALESPGSGVTCVGKSHRHFLDGNAGLARVGEATMRLALRDQCYLFKIPKGDAEDIIDNILGRLNLYQLGMTNKLQQYIRPREPVRASKQNSIWYLLADDLKGTGADPTRTIANGIKAIIGAVYFDGGLDNAKRVMAHFDLIIKLPELKYASMPEFGQTAKFA